MPRAMPASRQRVFSSDEQEAVSATTGVFVPRLRWRAMIFFVAPMPSNTGTGGWGNATP